MLLLDGAAAAGAIVVVGERGVILRSVDQGQNWQSAAGPASATLTGVSFASGTTRGWAVGHDALILASADGGRTWQQQWQGKNLEDSFLDVLALDAQHVIAIGAYGLFVTSTDGGKTWLRRKIIDEDYHLNRLTRGPSGTLYIAGEHGTLLRSVNHGATWERIDSPYDGSFYGILPLDSEILVAHGLRGRIYRSIDDGASWTPVPNDQRVLVATALRLRKGAIVFAGQSRSWFVSRDGAQSVAAWSGPPTPAVSRLLELSDGTILALGEAGAAILPAP
jgi:photosystem II stability/assembly factor-like uncharacterized protein